MGYQAETVNLVVLVIMVHPVQQVPTVSMVRLENLEHSEKEVLLAYGGPLATLVSQAKMALMEVKDLQDAEVNQVPEVDQVLLDPKAKKVDEGILALTVNVACGVFLACQGFGDFQERRVHEVSMGLMDLLVLLETKDHEAILVLLDLLVMSVHPVNLERKDWSDCKVRKVTSATKGSQVPDQIMVPREYEDQRVNAVVKEPKAKGALVAFQVAKTQLLTHYQLSYWSISTIKTFQRFSLRTTRRTLRV